MAGFDSIYITTAGAELAVKTLESKKLEFSVARLGSGTISDSSVSAIKARTALAKSVMEIAISKVKQTSETQATISFVFQNTKASSAFYFRELGIFAIDPDTKEEILFAYAYAGSNAEYVNNSVSEIIEKTINIVVTVDNASEVTISLDGSQVYVTEDELAEALEDAKLYSGKNYGVKRLVTDNTIASWTRIADAENLSASATKNGSEVANDFDDCYPWSDMRRCNVDPATGKVTAYYGETGFALDGSNGEVMVKVPEFWWKRERKTDEYGDEYEYIYIADYARAGYTKSEQFFVGAYLLSTATDDDGNEVAHSVTDAMPKHHSTLANFRTLAKAVGDGFCLLDYHYFLLQLLYLVEYAHYNSQSMLGNGITAYSTAAALMSESSTNRIIVSSVGTGLYVGKTVDIGTDASFNRDVAQDREITAIEDYDDGTISGKAVAFSGDAVDISEGNVIWGTAQKSGYNDALGNASGSITNNSYYPVSYRGIENIFGNMWQHIDGINIQDYQAYICKDPDSYAANVFTEPYKALGYVNAETTESYIKKLGYDENYPEVALPIVVEGSSTTGACDYYWCSSGNRIAYVGGNFSSNWSKGGFFAWHCNFTSSNSYWNYGARLLKYQ